MPGKRQAGREGGMEGREREGGWKVLSVKDRGRFLPGTVTVLQPSTALIDARTVMMDTDKHNL